jgi:hypothetical protein
MKQAATSLVISLATGTGLGYMQQRVGAAIAKFRRIRTGADTERVKHQ